MEYRLRNFLISCLALLLTQPLVAQHVSNRYASLIDVRAQQRLLEHTKDPLLIAAKNGLGSCVNTPLVPAPPSPIHIPSHYFNGSHGAINPAEVAARRIYGQFEARITAGMNQYVATGNQAEARCALDQLDHWAQADALLNYDAKKSTQSWFQVGWTLSSSGIVDSVLVGDKKLDPAQQKRVTTWLNTAAHKLISFEAPDANGNNLHYWRALAATAIGVASGDDQLFDFGIHVYKQAIDEIDARGALPREMVRHERAIHYQTFALQPLVPIAEFASRQHIDLYSYSHDGRTLRDAIVFFGRAVDDPSIVVPYNTDKQLLDFSGSDFAPYAFYVARFGDAGLPRSITSALKHPVTEPWIGGCTTILAARSH